MRGKWGAASSVGVLLVVFAACGSSGKNLTGFFCGGLAGSTCPPASQCDGSCGVPDCGVPCRANVTCKVGAGGCPVAYTCDAASLVCVPAKTCTSNAQCAATEWCASSAWRFSSGLCVAVDALKQAPSSPCAWPFTSRSGACGVPCDSVIGADGGSVDLCPPGMTCDTQTRLCH